MIPKTVREKTRQFVRLAALTGLAGLGMVVFWGHDASGALDTTTGDCSTSPDVCDLQQRSTTIRSVLWKSDTSSKGCSEAAWNALPKERYPKGTKDGTAVIVSGVRAPISFLNGVCEFHRTASSGPSGDADRGIAELQAAQQGRLMPAQRQAAGLFEGLLHCRKLEQLLKSFGGDWHKVEQAATAKGEFCSHRAQAKASFGNMSWVGFELGYDTKEWSVYNHIDNVSVCAERYLNASYDAACQIRQQLSLDEARIVGDRVATQVLAELLGGSLSDADGTGQVAEGAITSGRIGDFFGVSAASTAAVQVVPPITAIMARKLATAREAVDGASGQFDDLRARAAVLTAAVSALSTVMTEVGTAATDAVQTYGEAVRSAQEVVRFVDHWMKGFFQDSRGKDVRETLEVSRSDLGSARLGTNGSGNSEGTLQVLDLVLRDMQQLSQSGDREAGFMRRLCAIYFCEIQGRTLQSGLTTSACGTFDPISGQRYSASNDLCLDSGIASARTLCSSAGFASFTTSDTDACVKGAGAP
jgi:hypothetical protein